MLDLRPFWPLVVPLFVRWMREQFESEGGWGGDPWAPLTPDYAAWKAEHYPGRSILYATGDMRRAASNPERDATPISLSLTIVDPKIEFHQGGTDKMVARPVIPAELPFGADVELTEAANGYVRENLRRFGLA
jgi:hypothetical protein